MQLTVEQFEKIAPYFPKKRGKLSLSDHQVFNAILFVAVNGCKWRALPKEFGNWHTTYTRMNRWAKKGVLDRIFTLLQEKGIIKMKLERLYTWIVSLSKYTHMAQEHLKNGPQCIGRSRGGWTTKLHMVAADA